MNGDEERWLAEFVRVAGKGDTPRLRRMVRLRPPGLPESELLCSGALCEAALCGHIEACEFLLAFGCDPRARDRHGRSAAHFGIVAEGLGKPEWERGRGLIRAALGPAEEVPAAYGVKITGVGFTRDHGPRPMEDIWQIIDGWLPAVLPKPLTPGNRPDFGFLWLYAGEVAAVREAIEEAARDGFGFAYRFGKFRGGDAAGRPKSA